MREFLSIGVILLIATACGDRNGTETDVSAAAGGLVDPAVAEDSAPVIWDDRVRVIVTGEAEGVTWRVVGWWDGDPAVASERFCIETESDRYPISRICPSALPPLNTGGPGGPTLRPPQIVLTDELKFVVGKSAYGLARIVVEMTSGPSVEAQIVANDGSYYVAPLSLEASPLQVVAYAISGAELDRRGFDEPAEEEDVPEAPTHRVEYFVE